MNSSAKISTVKSFFHTRANWTLTRVALLVLCGTASGCAADQGDGDAEEAAVESTGEQLATASNCGAGMSNLRRTWNGSRLAYASADWGVLNAAVGSCNAGVFIYACPTPSRAGTCNNGASSFYKVLPPGAGDRGSLGISRAPACAGRAAGTAMAAYMSASVSVGNAQGSESLYLGTFNCP